MITVILFIVGNVAFQKPTLQSSTGYYGVSSRAVDGNTNSDYFGGSSCTHTNRQRNAWWRVDLGRVWAVGKVKITNRGDCCEHRLRAFEVRVGNKDNDPKANPL